MNQPRAQAGTRHPSEEAAEGAAAGQIYSSDSSGSRQSSIDSRKESREPVGAGRSSIGGREEGAMRGNDDGRTKPCIMVLPPARNAAHLPSTISMCCTPKPCTSHAACAARIGIDMSTLSSPDAVWPRATSTRACAETRRARRGRCRLPGFSCSTANCPDSVACR